MRPNSFEEGMKGESVTRVGSNRRVCWEKPKGVENSRKACWERGRCVLNTWRGLVRKGGGVSQERQECVTHLERVRSRVTCVLGCKANLTIQV